MVRRYKWLLLFVLNWTVLALGLYGLTLLGYHFHPYTHFGRIVFAIKMQAMAFVNAAWITAYLRLGREGQ